MRKSMQKITTRQFQLLTDIDRAWNFLVEVSAAMQERESACIEAPFFEYALVSKWMNTMYVHQNRFWLENDRVVGFVFYENPINNVHFALHPAYEGLADEMIDYAMNHFPNAEAEKEFVFAAGQQALIRAAEKRGYHLCAREKEYLLNLEKAELNFPLPPGFHFVEPAEVDPVKLARCCWKGFNEWELGPFEHWNVPNDSPSWTPHRSYLDVESNWMAPSPHATPAYEVIIADEAGEYACYAGMWWVEENKLAYMEPLCTIPSYQHRGLAAAALTRHCQRFRAMGGKYMTGGDNDFYRKIGYDTEVYALIYRREKAAE